MEICRRIISALWRYGLKVMMVPRHGTDLGALLGIAANYAGMVELADTYGLGPYASRMRVQVSPRVPFDVVFILMFGVHIFLCASFFLSCVCTTVVLLL